MWRPLNYFLFFPLLRSKLGFSGMCSWSEHPPEVTEARRKMSSYMTAEQRMFRSLTPAVLSVTRGKLAWDKWIWQSQKKSAKIRKMCGMHNNYLSSSLNVVSFDLDTSWASSSWDPAYNFRQERVSVHPECVLLSLKLLYKSDADSAVTTWAFPNINRVKI